MILLRSLGSQGLSAPLIWIHMDPWVCLKIGCPNNIQFCIWNNGLPIINGKKHILIISIEKKYIYIAICASHIAILEVPKKTASITHAVDGRTPTQPWMVESLKITGINSCCRNSSIQSISHYIPSIVGYIVISHDISQKIVLSYTVYIYIYILAAYNIIAIPCYTHDI